MKGGSQKIFETAGATTRPAKHCTKNEVCFSLMENFIFCTVKLVKPHTWRF